MSHKYVSSAQTDIFLETFGLSLDFEQEFDESYFIGKEDLLKVLVDEGYLSKGLESRPHKPKGFGFYEDGKSYPSNRVVIKDGNIYKSKVDTSVSWIYSEVEGEPSEWEILVKGL